MKDKKLKSLKILLVEDEQEIAKLLKSAIGDNFHSFLIANDGAEGFDIYLKTSPDIIITDIMMPNVSGLEMAKKIREENKNIPILVLSAFSEKEKLLSAIDISINKYFIKPYSPRDILKYISGIVDEIGDKKIKLHDGFVFDKNRSSLYKDTKYVQLTKKETILIKLILNSEDRIIDYNSVKSAIWEDEEVSDDRLRTFVKRLREKTSKTFIQTVKGMGYKINFICIVF